MWAIVSTSISFRKFRRENTKCSFNKNDAEIALCFLIICIIDDLRSSRIKSFQRFLVRSCQNELMRSNNFVVKVAGKKCSEVEAQANNYENKASV